MKKTERTSITGTSPTGRLSGKTIVLGVTGSIAAYKAVALTRAMRREGAVVHAVMTPTARHFVGPLTFEVLTGHPVAMDLFAPHNEMLHLTLAEAADVIVIAPASAHCLAKLAHGLADDVLSTMVLAAECPLVVVPAMDGGMWDHPAVRQNVRTLRARWVIVMEPDTGALASGRVGKGRFPEENAILAVVFGALASRKDLEGRRVLVTAGPTQEALDPVRFLSNRSSGKMGWALAEAARDRGAQVVLISGPTGLPRLPQVSLVHVTTSEELRKAVITRFAETDVLIMAAAVADFRPARTLSGKIPKAHGRLRLELEPTPDILTELPPRRPGQLVVGFAAETGRLVERARRKLQEKKLDLIVANDVTEPGAGFGTDTNRVTLLDRTGRCDALPLMSKRAVADHILSAVLRLPGVGDRRKRVDST